MDDLEPIAQARAAAEAIRQLNHATIRREGYTWPSDVDAVMAELHLTAARMEQALEQARRWLNRAHTAGRVGHDERDDLKTAVADVDRWLATSAADARVLASTLSRARSLTAHLTGLNTAADLNPGLR